MDGEDGLALAALIVACLVLVVGLGLLARSLYRARQTSHHPFLADVTF